MNDILAMAGKYTSQAILELSNNESLLPIAPVMMKKVLQLIV